MSCAERQFDTAIHGYKCYLLWLQTSVGELALNIPILAANLVPGVTFPLQPLSITYDPENLRFDFKN